ncbi:unnamed protein product [Didymodactylos carnosus]|uniref:Uncharacterized protein n=1 Tax=Didymodactylos carnosus TaxID=1234261 RepID=A0A813RDT5_9BILA|nr:unnamed protein product [Didymodactylos carnosus]CAF3565773.1 unnamed protein product [Didymodactylos carnosus]
MAKFLQRLFSGGSSTNKNSLHSSQTSLNNSGKLRQGGTIGGSLENLASYHIKTKDLEKNKLHKASWDGNLHKVQRLAKPGAINIRDQDKRTPLHLAIVRGHLNIVKYLVQEDAQLHLTDNENRTPLIKAVLSGNQNPKLNYEIVKELIFVGDGGQFINAVDLSGKNALHYAIELNRLDLVQLFTHDKRCDVNFQDRDFQTPLHLAIKVQNLQILNQLLLAHADPNVKNRNGQTPLILATSLNYIDTVKILLENNADTQLVDNQQMNAVDIAKKHHHNSCAQIILEYDKQQKDQESRKKSVPSIQQQSISERHGLTLNPMGNDSSDDSSSSDEETKVKTQSVGGEQSDDNTILTGKEQQKGLGSLMKNIPLQQPSVDKIHQVNNDNKNRITNAANTVKQSSSTFDIKSITNRNKESDDTSISAHFPEKPMVATKMNDTYAALVASTPLSDAIKTRSSSWSDEVDDSIHQGSPHTIVRLQNKKKSETWDDDSGTSSPSSYSRGKNKTTHKSDQSKPTKTTVSSLASTLPFILNSASVFKTDQQNEQMYVSDDDDPIEEEVRNKIASPRQNNNNNTNENNWNTMNQLTASTNGVNLFNKNITGKE